MSLAVFCWDVQTAFAESASTSSQKAKCTRADFLFYLDGGFSKKQAKALCLGGARERGRPRKSKPPAYSPRQKRIDEDLAFLKDALYARAIAATPDRLEYVRPICIKLENSSELNARRRICISTLFLVYFPRLRVIDVGREFLIFGRGYVKVRGKIKYKRLDNLSGYSKGLRKRILAIYRRNIQKNVAEIPLRKDYQAGRVAAVLKRMSKAASR